MDEFFAQEHEDLDLATQMISAGLQGSSTMSTWAAHTGVHRGPAASAAAEVSAAASGVAGICTLSASDDE